MAARGIRSSASWDSSALMTSVEGRLHEDSEGSFESPEVTVVTYRSVIAPHCQHRVSCYRTRLTREHGGQPLLLVRRGSTLGTLVHAIRQSDWSLVLVGIAWVEIERCGPGRARFRVLPWPAVTAEAMGVSKQVRRALSQLADFTPHRDLRDDILAVLRSKDLRVLSDRVPGAFTTDAASMTKISRQPLLADRLRLGLDWAERELKQARVCENSSRKRLSAKTKYKMRDLTLWRRFLPGATRGAILYDSEQQPAETSDLLLMCTERPSAVWALRKSDGITVWKRSIPQVIGVPQLESNIAVVKLDRGVAGLDVTTGAVLWTFRPKLPKSDLQIGLPVVTRDACFVAGGSRAYRLSLAEGDVCWDVPFDGDLLASVSDLVLASGNSGFTALSQSSGETLWTRAGLPSHECVISPGTVAVFRSGWGLTWVEPIGGETLAVWKLGDGERIDSFCTAGELVFIVLAHDENPRDFSIVALECGKVLYRCPAHQRAQLRFEPSTGVLNEWTFEGLAMLSPTTGERLADIVGGRHLYCVPAIRDGLIHCFTLDAQVWAMRHPLARSDGAESKR